MSTTTAHAAPPPTYQRTAGLAAGIATWVVFSGVVLTGTGWDPVHNALVGTAIAIAAAYTAGWPTGGRLPAVVAPLVATLLGLWLALSTLVFEVSSDLLLGSTVLSGALIAVLMAASAYGAVRSRSPD